MRLFGIGADDDQDWSTNARCSGVGNGGGGCGVLLLVEEADLLVTRTKLSVKITCSFRCAACGTITDIDVPKEVEKRLHRLTTRGGT